MCQYTRVPRCLTSVAFAALVMSQPATAANINDAFLAMEAGTPALSFAGPEGGTISLGYNLTPTTPGTFASAGLTHTDAFNTVANLEGWFVSNNAIVPALLVNTSNAVSVTNFGVTMAVDQILLHPGNPGGDAFAQPASAAVLRYTVPTTGAYDISGSFDDIAAGTVAVDILRNGTSILSSGSGADATSFDELGVNLVSGDSLDFVVDDAGDIGSDSTGLYASVILVPEPSTAALMLSGLVGLALTRSMRGGSCRLLASEDT
jgi:hypothetical protein